MCKIIYCKFRAFRTLCKDFFYSAYIIYLKLALKDLQMIRICIIIINVSRILYNIFTYINMFYKGEIYG